jgi:hypothetical protein
MKTLNLMMFIVFGFCSFACAYDIPAPGSKPNRPDPPPSEETADTDAKDAESSAKRDLTEFRVYIERDATEAKLIIPTSIIRELSRDADKSSYLPPRNWIEDRPIPSRMGTVIGGMLLALSILFGGLWLIRNHKLSAANVGTIALLLTLSGIGTASIVYANAGPPPPLESLTGKIFSQAVHTRKKAFGELRVETSDYQDNIDLIVPDSK